MNHIFPVDEKKVWIQSNKRFDVRKLCTQFCVVTEKHFENNLSISSWIVTSLWFVSSGLPFFFPPLSSFAEDQIARGFLMLFSEKFWWPHLPKPTETHYLPPSPEHFHGFDKKKKNLKKKQYIIFASWMNRWKSCIRSQIGVVLCISHVMISTSAEDNRFPCF